MQTQQARGRHNPAVPLRPREVPDRRIRPVNGWALAGAASLVLWVVTWAAWIGSGNFQPTSSGPTPIPYYMRLAIFIQMVLATGLLVICGYLFVWRPWRREGRLSLDGVICIALLSCFWQDPIPNSIRTTVVFNTGFLQFGSWSNFLPGWIQPNGNLFSEPLLFEFPLYVGFAFPPILLCCYLMRRAKERWPGIGAVGLVSIAIATVTVFDMTLEVPWLLQGLYAFPGSIRWLTLFHGHYYQFPVYEALLTGLLVGAWASIRFFVDDHGRTIAERGIDEVAVPRRQKGALRVLAVCGLFNVVFFLAYNAPMALIHGLYGDAWPEDITKRSYFTQGMCGAGSDYACPSPEIPIPHRASDYVNTRGDLVSPGGP